MFRSDRSLMYRLMLAVIPLLLTACSNKAIYDNIQLNNRLECNKVPPAQYDACIERTNMSYEAYERARKASGRD